MPQAHCVFIQYMCFFCITRCIELPEIPCPLRVMISVIGTVAYGYYQIKTKFTSPFHYLVNFINRVSRSFASGAGYLGSKHSA